ADVCLPGTGQSWPRAGQPELQCLVARPARSAQACARLGRCCRLADPGCHSDLTLWPGAVPFRPVACQRPLAGSSRCYRRRAVVGKSQAFLARAPRGMSAMTASSGALSDAVLGLLRANSALAVPIVFVLAFGESLVFVSLLLPATALLVAGSALIRSA